MADKIPQPLPAQANRASHNRTDTLPLPGTHPDLLAVRSSLAVTGAARFGVIRRQPRDRADLEDPTRFDQVNQALFAQSITGTALQAWVDPAAGVPGTGAQITQQFLTAFRQFIAANPMATGGTVTPHTTNADADADAVTAEAQLTARFPFIQNPLTANQLAARVSVFNESISADDAFVRARLNDKLFESTDIGQFQIQHTDPRVEQVLTDILADSFVGPRFRIMAGRAGAFTSTQGPQSEIFLHEGLNAGQRMRTLMHEIAHFSENADYRTWIDQSSNGTFFNEGFTEFLARLAMTTAQRQARETEGGNRQANFEAIRDRVARFASDDDLARAFFLGEVWRLEASTQVAQQLFARDVGLPANPAGRAEGTEEKQAAATARGIVEEAIPGEWYRFMNIDIEQSAPRPEHVAGLRDILQRHVLGQADARVEFTGFASAPGSERFNLELSARRARDFYALARSEGVPPGQLLNEANPPARGEASPTAGNATAHGRAFNRRVELAITRAP